MVEHEDIAEIYSRLLDKSIDAKTLSYWVNALKNGSTTLEELVNFLIHSDEYKNKVETMFKQVYFEHVGFEDVTIMFEVFWKQIKKEITYSDIEHFVTSSDSYKKKILQMIETAMQMNRIETNEETIKYYLDQFVSNPTYSYEDLQDDLKNNIHGSQTNNLTTIEIENVNNNNVDIVTKQKMILDKAALETFHKIFGRPMYVEEYFKYVLNSECTLDYKLLYESHSSNFNKLQAIHNDYLNTYLSECDYVQTFLDKIDQEHFIEQFISDIVDSNEYYDNMAKQILIWYKKLYDATIDKEEILYIFKSVKAKKLHLYDDRVVDEIKAFKQETDSIIERIFECFHSVLRRQPDMSEIDVNLQFFREQLIYKDLDSLCVEIESVLMQSLEFHDVLKTKIKEHSALINTDIQQSKLYSILQKLVLSITSKTSIKDIDDLISIYVQ